MVTLVGPRQSGKPTLARALFPDYEYITLEDPDRRRLATEDPRGFFKRYSGNLILDEIQRAPELLSYIQGLVDEPGAVRRFVLTGSHQLLLMEKVSQTLAGRTVIAKLLPFSKREIDRHPHPHRLEDYLFTGGYPRIYDRQLNPSTWLSQYLQTYVERDVRSLLRIGELDTFDRFLRLCAGRVGQLLNLSSLGADCGISQPTAGAWLSVLQTSFVAFTLRPHFRNFHKRLIKSPKLYFYDTGLLCHLLNISSPEMLRDHPFRGNIFENWVITERMKEFFNRGIEPPIYFWRDTKGHEIDLVLDEGTYLFPIEIKSSYTFHPDFLKNVRFLAQLQSDTAIPSPAGECVYAGEESFDFETFRVRSWIMPDANSNR